MRRSPDFRVQPKNISTLYTVASCAAGGPAGGFGAVIPPWMGSKTKAVTAAIGVCVDCEPPKG